MCVCVSVYLCVRGGGGGGVIYSCKIKECFQCTWPIIGSRFCLLLLFCLSV